MVKNMLNSGVLKEEADTMASRRVLEDLHGIGNNFLKRNAFRDVVEYIYSRHISVR